MTRLSAYNPGALSRDDVVEGFVAREKLLAHIAADLRKEQPQQWLLIGPRGMGKTTLLRRLHHAIDEESALASRWVPLSFREEQYNVASLADFWLNCLEALIDWLEARGKASDVAKLEAELERLRELPAERLEREALKSLESQAQTRRRKLCLLVDNADMVFERLSGDELWRLRELLSGRRMLLIGSSLAAPPTSYEYNAPFYDFFRLETLHGLDDAEAHRALVTLAKRRRTPEVARIVREEPARVQVLRLLSGGNPRALVMVHHILADGQGDAVADVLSLLDMCTPLYKARFEALSPQAQVVVDALALAWDPVTAARLAKLTRLDVNIVSSQLSRLSSEGTIEKVKYPGARAGFQLAERLFQVWYLMRAGRRSRQRLLWLVEFLAAYFADPGAGGMPDLGSPLALPSQADEALVRLDAEGLGERHRPFREALLAVLNGHDHLITVAPEVREPAARIQRWIVARGDKLHEAPRPRSSRRRGT
jgi:hypothetical protein